MRTLDLFSGIGGFAVALQCVTKVAAYCEIDAACRSVLAANIRKGLLHNAPILDDVTKVSDLSRTEA
jgi:site-specific DNA-cytosine methylase